jgi:uncharacterized protein YjbI with pentapeptide repeats
MKIRIFIVASAALFAAASSTLAGSQLQGGDTNGSSLQGESLNGAQLQGAQLQGSQPNGVNLQGLNPNGLQMQGHAVNQPVAPRPQARSTGLVLPTVHVVGGQLFSGQAPASTRRP